MAPVTPEPLSPRLQVVLRRGVQGAGCTEPEVKALCQGGHPPASNRTVQKVLLFGSAALDNGGRCLDVRIQAPRAQGGPHGLLLHSPSGPVHMRVCGLGGVFCIITHGMPRCMPCEIVTQRHHLGCVFLCVFLGHNAGLAFGILLSAIRCGSIRSARVDVGDRPARWRRLRGQGELHPEKHDQSGVVQALARGTVVCVLRSKPVDKSGFCVGALCPCPVL
jgi:hypothetical protein